jgi:tetratricopeptide (TPR) repeat protein
MFIPPAELREIERLQDANLHLKAHEIAKPLGDLRLWEGTEGILIASQLAHALGATEEASRLTSRAWHRDPGDSSAIFYYSIQLLEKRGPLPALMFMRKFPDFKADDKLMSWWFSLYGQLHSSLRDFSVSERWHKEAMAACPGEPWVWVSRSYSLHEQDLFDAALESARRGLELSPTRRSTVSSTAHFLTLLERDQEALELLSSVVDKVENAWLVKQLAELQAELGMNSEAYITLQKCFGLLPLLDEETGKWLYGNLSDTAYLIGDIEKALEYAGKVSDGFYNKVRENLADPGHRSTRVLLDVGFLHQHHVTCAPATISNLSRYWKKNADHLELVDAICYDGTPSYKERIWAESNGWATREFTLNWEDATSLLDRGVPLTLATIYPGGGHLQAIIGYDSRRKTYLVRDPYHRRTGEVLAEELQEDQKSSGPRVMALVPVESREVIEGAGRSLFESEIYDLLHQVEAALEKHDRETALAASNELDERFPGHRLTFAAHWAISSYDANELGVRSALQALLNLFPDDVNLRLSDISISASFTGRLERLDKLEAYSLAKSSDPLIWQMFGFELGFDAKKHRRALHWIFRSVRKSPNNGLTYRFIADILWSQRRFDEATELYRFASCLNDKDEQFAYSYFLAMRFLKREDEAIEVLADRFERFGKQSGLPVQSLFNALRELGRVDEAFDVLQRALEKRPDDGELKLYVADARAQFGRTEDARSLLEVARTCSSETAWLRSAAKIHQITGELAGALSMWREVLEVDPTAFDAHENIAFLLKGLEGVPAVKEYLRRICRKFPRNRRLQVLRLQYLNEEPDEAIAVLRDLIRSDPEDVWSLRELSYWYMQVGKYGQALDMAEQALAADPNDATSHWFRGHALEFSKQYSEAAKAYRHSIGLNVDHVNSISSWLRITRTLEHKREVLETVWSELNTQVSMGDGLFEYRESASRILDRKSLLAKLQDYAAGNRRSWFAHSAVIQQLAELGNTNEALDLAEEAVRRFPLVHQIWNDLALVCRLRGDAVGEIEALRTAISINPLWSYGVQRLAEAYHRVGRFEESRDLLIDALARLPFDNFLLGYLADCYWSLGQNDAAIKTARRAVTFEPDYKWAWNSIKRWAEKTGDGELPARLARELTVKKPKDIRAWINLAEMLDNDTFSTEQMEAIDAALRIDPYSPTALSIKARVLCNARRFDEAIAVARTVLTDGHRPEQLRFNEADIEAMRGNRSACLDVLIELTESSPDYLAGWSRLADIYRTDPERDHEYRKASLQLVRLAPHEPVSYGYLAEACLKLDLKEEAREALQQAVNLEPTYDYAVVTLFDLLLNSNDISGAEDLVESVKAASSAAGLPIAVELAIQKNDKDRVFLLLKELLTQREVERESLDRTMEKVTGFVGRRDRSLLEVLRDVSAAENVDPVTGRYFIEAVWRTESKRGCETALAGIAGNSKLWAHAASRYMEILAEAKPRELTRFIDEHSALLAAETESWGATGYQLCNQNDAARMSQWFAGWQSRDGLMPWMLWNYSIVLRRDGKASEADEISSAAVWLRRDESVDLHLTMIGLTQFRKRNFGEARTIVSRINPGTMSDWDRFFYNVLKESLWATECLQSGDIEGAKAIGDSIASSITVFDPKNKDRMVRDQVVDSLYMLLDLIGSKWFSIRTKARLLYFRYM